MRALLDAHIAAPLRPPVSVLSSNFDEEIGKLESDAARVSELEHAIRHEIDQRFDANPVWYQHLRERLTRINDDRRESRIDAATHLRMLSAIAHDLRNVEEVAQAMGLDDASWALYQLLGATDEPDPAS